MKVENLKQLLPYAGIPFICAALLLTWAGGKDAITLLKLEMIVLIGYIAAVIDLKTMRIPNMLVLVMLAAWIAIMIPRLFMDVESALTMLLDSALGLATGGGLFLLVYLLSRNGLGAGDVKFMAVSGLYLGFSGTIPAIFFGTLLGSMIGLALILLKKISRKDVIPLAPFLYIGMLITLFLQ